MGAIVTAHFTFTTAVNAMTNAECFLLTPYSVSVLKKLGTVFTGHRTKACGASMWTECTLAYGTV